MFVVNKLTRMNINKTRITLSFIVKTDWSEVRHVLVRTTANRDQLGFTHYNLFVGWTLLPGNFVSNLCY